MTKIVTPSFFNQFFNSIVIIYFIDVELIDLFYILFAGGSALHIHADPDVLLAYRFSFSEADIGWDSKLASYYFGFTFYNINYHNPNLGLPALLRFNRKSF